MSVTPEQWVEFAMQEGATLFGNDLPLKQQPHGTSLTAIASSLTEVARFVKPEVFMPLVPPSVQRILREITLEPPLTVDEIFYFESSNYRASFFEGLTEEQISKKIDEERQARKQERFDAIWSVHHYFAEA